MLEVFGSKILTNVWNHYSLHFMLLNANHSGLSVHPSLALSRSHTHRAFPVPTKIFVCVRARVYSSDIFGSENMIRSYFMSLPERFGS